MILSVIKKEILQNFRDKKAMFWMILFPIIMIFILGNALGQFFGKGEMKIPKTTVIYTIEKNSKGNETKSTENLEKFFTDSEENLNMNFIKGQDRNKILEGIKRGKYDCYLDIKKNGDIKVYSNNLKDFNASLVTNLLEIYMEKNNVIDSIKDIYPEGLKFINVNENPNIVQVKSIEKAKTPSAFDYYSVTMLTMIVLYSTLAGAMTVIGERVRGTMKRLACSPIKKFTLYMGKLIGAYIVVAIQIGVLFLFTKYVFRADWGNNLLSIILILVSAIFMAISLGMGLAGMFRNPNIISVSTNILIVLLNFLGGAYIPLDTFGNNNILTYISNISPLKWTNSAIFKIIYFNDFSIVNTAILVNILIGLFFIIVPFFFTRKGEV